MPLPVIYEDNHLIGINKPVGMLVQGDETGDLPLPDLVKEYLRHKYNKPGNVFAGLIHRLDRPVSGVVVLAKTSKALTRMNELFRSHNLSKKYWAIVTRQPQQPEAKLVHWLVKDAARNIVKAYTKEVANSQRAELHYQLLAGSGRQFLLEVDLLTGRPHQIRTQLSSIGCPIIGDLKYGAPAPNPDASICLHSRTLRFEHPVSKTPVTLYAPLPGTAIWKEFAALDRHHRPAGEK